MVSVVAMAVDVFLSFPVSAALRVRSKVLTIHRISLDFEFL